MQRNQITSTGASMLCDLLRTTESSIKEVWLSDNKQINDECMKSLGEYIKYNKSIEGILLNRNKISDTGIEILASYLDGNTTFKGLYLNGNKGITDKSIPLLMKMIESSYIERMDLYNTLITQKNIIDVCIPLTCNKIRNGSSKLDLSQK